MPRKKKIIVLSEPTRDRQHSFQARLDTRTVITLNSAHSWEFWKKRYPKAVIISGSIHES